MRYLWLSAFAICGIALYLYIETWAQAHREAQQRLLEELNDEWYWEELHVNQTTSWPDSITVPNDNGTTIIHSSTQ